MQPDNYQILYKNHGAKIGSWENRQRSMVA